jgi:hypothetical protein
MVPNWARLSFKAQLADAMKISPTLAEPRDGDLIGVEA